MEAGTFIFKNLEIMNVDDIKNIWNNDMKALESRVRINEDRIKQLEFNKAQSSFDKFLKISLAGKNMALLYAAASVALMYLVRDSSLYIVMLAVGAGLMVFSFFQHSVLKKIDYASLSIIELQKAIHTFRKHTARTAVYDITIVAVWMITAGLAFMKWAKGFDVFENSSELGYSVITVGVLVLLMVIFSKHIYKDYDVKLKESEDNLVSITSYEKN